MGDGLKFYIRTYGCQMNEHDTEVMAGIFMQLGYTPTETVEDADVVLLNTCAIRENAENKVFGEIGHLKPLKTEKPDMLIGVCGCMSQEESVVNKILQKHPHVDMVFGTHNIHRLPYILKEAYMSKAMVVEVWSKEGDVIESLPKVRKGNIKAWVNIMYGCDKFCTYCIVPYTRGKERSRRPEDIIQEVRELAAKGYKEITLLGQNVNAYGKDFDDLEYGLGDLMDDLRKINIPRIRFTTSHPRDFDDRLIEVLAKKETSSSISIFRSVRFKRNFKNYEAANIRGNNIWNSSEKSKPRFRMWRCPPILLSVSRTKPKSSLKKHCPCIKKSGSKRPIRLFIPHAKARRQRE